MLHRVDETRRLYGYKPSFIVQGSTYKDFAETIGRIHYFKNRDGKTPLEAYRFGRPAEMMYEMTELVCDILPSDKPRYLMV